MSYNSGWTELDNLCNSFFAMWTADVKTHAYSEVRIKIPGMIELNKLLYESRIPIALRPKREQILPSRTALNNYMTTAENAKAYTGDFKDQAVIGSVTDARFQLEELYLICVS